MKNIYYILNEKRYIGRKQIHGKLITVHAKTQLECKKKLSEAIKNFLNKDNNIKTTSSNEKFIDYIQKWYKQDKEPFVVEKTKKDIKYVIKNLEPLHNMNIKKISKDILIDYLSKYETSRLKEKITLYLKAIFKHAFNNNVIKNNPFNTILTEPKILKKKDAFTYNEQVLLLEAIKNKNIKYPIMIYLLTGLRKNELDFKNIEKHINFENNVLKAINLKGRNKVVRYKHIRLSNELIKMIMNNLNIIHEYNSEKCYREFLDIMKELNIEKSIVNLRHTFATNHLYLGTPEFVIAKEMGHSSSLITKNHYMDIDYNLSKEKILKLYNNLYPLFL